MATKMDLIGRTFTRLTVINGAGRDRHGRCLWLCRCDCGIEKVVRGSHLTSGATKSCGCLHKEIAAKTMHEQNYKWVIKHGMYNTRIYKIFLGAKYRCTNKNNTSYPRYGGRGIKFLWGNFEEFRNWALANGYDNTKSIDRIDVNGNYEPSNCRWITNNEQQRNRRDSRIIEIDGIKRCLQEWCEIYGINGSTVWKREKMGIGIIEAIKRPVNKKLCGTI
jgi:hypothetical protein